jgi:hypothetical protein
MLMNYADLISTVGPYVLASAALALRIRRVYRPRRRNPV